MVYQRSIDLTPQDGLRPWEPDHRSLPGTEASSFVTGQVIVVDGGYTIW